MANNLTIVMYHYVRPLQKTSYPALKALELDDFKGQLDYLQQQYQPVRMEEVIAAAKEGFSLPERAVLLTFDDGYRDHYEYVLPQLVRRGIQGSFFPPACAIRENRVLDVNKIHFMLASVAEANSLVEIVFDFLDSHREAHGLRSNSDYYTTYAGESRYDTPDAAFVKRLLQKGLPQSLRETLIDRLFAEFVTTDARGFAEQLYMSRDELKALKDAGMFLGSHGDQHQWMNTLSVEDQRREIDTSLAFLTELGVPIQDWVMCYPYGGYDSSLLALLRTSGCTLGLTVNVGMADLSKDDLLLLPRWDTNDLPVAVPVDLK